ncbi:MAG: hypothetical protein LBE24_10560 [Methylobacillus sp.]|jgi:hypothetical protein|nr:hypothetical protein [Methylobacillus sp.]
MTDLHDFWVRISVCRSVASVGIDVAQAVRHDIEQLNDVENLFQALCELLKLCEQDVEKLASEIRGIDMAAPPNVS